MNEIEKAIEMLKSKMDGNTDTSYEWCATVRIAIQALQEKQERDKLKCESCAFHHEARYENEGKRPYIKHGCTFFNRQIHLGSFCSYFEPKE